MNIKSVLKRFLKEGHRWLYSLASGVLQILPDTNLGNRVRGIILGLFMKGGKKGLQISKAVHILYPQNLCLGDHVYIGFNSWINAQGIIEIEDNVIIGPFVSISSGNHTFANGSYRFGAHDKKKVCIEQGVWVASHVSINAGVTVGYGSIIASGAAVVCDVEENSLYAGVPAKFKKRLR